MNVLYTRDDRSELKDMPSLVSTSRAPDIRYVLWAWFWFGPSDGCQWNARQKLSMACERSQETFAVVRVELAGSSGLSPPQTASFVHPSASMSEAMAEIVALSASASSPSRPGNVVE